MANTLSLTSNQLEHWFATIERNNEPDSIKTDSSLSIQFLSRFGLKEAAQVMEFLKTAAGNETINMIVQELIKEEEKAQAIRERTEEEMLRQQCLVFLLMTLIAKEKEKTEHVNEIMQQQIDEKLLKEAKTEAEPITVHMVDANIRADKIQAFDKELKKLESDLNDVDEELNRSEEELVLMEENLEDITENLDLLNTFFQAPLFNDQPITQYIDYTNQQITSLTTQLATLKTEYAQIPTSDDNISTVQETKSRTERKIRRLEDQLSFHQAQLAQPPQTHEQAFQQLIERVQTQIAKQEQINEKPQSQTPEQVFQQLIERIQTQIAKQKQINEKPQFPVHREREVEDLRLQERGLSQAPQLPNHLTEKDWLHAKLNYNKLKLDVCTVNSLYNERKEQVQTLRERIHNCQSRRQNLMNRIETVQTNKIQLLQENTPFSMTPKPRPKPTPKLEPKSSYSMMLKCLLPTHAPAPRPEDIRKVRNKLEAVVAPERKGELKELINEVKPGEIMAPEARLGWLYRVKKLIPDLPVPELDTSLKHQKK